MCTCKADKCLGARCADQPYPAICTLLTLRRLLLRVWAPSYPVRDHMYTLQRTGGEGEDLFHSHVPALFPGLGPANLV